MDKPWKNHREQRLFPKRLPSYQVYGQVREKLGARIEGPIRRQVVRQVADALLDQPSIDYWHARWSAKRDELVPLIWEAIDSLQEDGEQ